MKTLIKGSDLILNIKLEDMNKIFEQINLDYVYNLYKEIMQYKKSYN